MDATVDYINAMNVAWVIALSVITFIPGVIGITFNLLVFTRPTVRQEPCSLYFFSASCHDLFVLLVALPVRIASNAFKADAAHHYPIVCRLEFYAFHITRAISSWLVTMACVDRFFHSSTNIRLRRLSTIKTARMIVAIISVSITVAYSHMIVYFVIENVIDRYGRPVPTCDAKKGFYRNFLTFWHMLLYSVLPTILTLLFGCLTIRNIQQGRQALPAAGSNAQSTRRSNSQLLRMLIAQVIVIIIATLPYSVVRFYVSATSDVVKDEVQKAQENLALQLFSTATYFAHASSFYLYTLIGSAFRKEVVKIIAWCYPCFHKLLPSSRARQNQISALSINP